MNGENTTLAPSLGRQLLHDLKDCGTGLLQHFKNKMFSSVKFTILFLSSALIFDWIASYYFPYPTFVFVFVGVIVFDVFAAVMRDIRRGPGFQSKKLKRSLPTFVAYFFILGILHWLSKALVLAHMPAEILPILGWSTFVIAHFLSGLKNLILAEVIPKAIPGIISRLIYNIVDPSKNEKNDTLYKQFEERKKK